MEKSRTRSELTATVFAATANRNEVGLKQQQKEATYLHLLMKKGEILMFRPILSVSLIP